jgi:hypothetical protein
MKTEPKRTCPSCGNELSGVDQSCPVCMLRKGLDGGVASSESSTSRDTVDSTPEQATQRFEHYELVTGEDGKPIELGRGAMGITYKAFDVDLLLVPLARKRKPQNFSGPTDRNISFPGTAINFLTFREAVGRNGSTE